MIKTFTQTDLIRYLYREITEEEKTEIDSALLRDSELAASFNELKNTLDSLDQAQMNPSNAAILNILSYSRSLEEKH